LGGVRVHTEIDILRLPHIVVGRESHSPDHHGIDSLAVQDFQNILGGLEKGFRISYLFSVGDG
jgi:hypothetical protein